MTPEELDRVLAEKHRVLGDVMVKAGAKPK